MSEPPLDDAFRSALRRQLMNRAWGMGETSAPWWRKAFEPAGLAWAGAAVGVILIAAVVVFTAISNPGTDTRQVDVTSPMSDQSAVKLQQPILVMFNQAMDHPSTEAAVQITPATTVAYSWQANTLSVQPTSGNLAPNSQHQVASVPDGISIVMWSPDSSIVYFTSSKGALESVPAAGGNVTVLAADGVTSAALAPAGDQLAYVRNGKIEVLAIGSGTTSEISPTLQPSIVGWAKHGVVWAAADGVYVQAVDGPVKLASLPTSGLVVSLSFAPDGAHLAYTQDQSLQLLDVVSGKSIALGLSGARFLGWSPDGTGVMYTGAQGVVIYDVGGKNTTALPPGEPGWSSQDGILLGSDTDLWQVRPDGSSLTKLADGTYHLPVWAPNGIAFTYVRGGALFSASAPALPPKSSPLDSAASVVNAFMQARKGQQADKAAAFLDDSGKQSYSSSNGGLNLLVTGDPSFSRYYVLTQEITGSQPDTAQFVVRIVLSHNKLDVSTYEETLTLVRTQGSQQFLVDQAAAGPLLSLGKGAEVVSVDVSPGTVKITFDSDLMPATVPAGVIILDSKGKQVGGNPEYANRTVTIGGLDLKPGASYKLVVLSTVQDVCGKNIAAEYDLTFEGPGDSHGGDKHKDQSPAPSPRVSTSPSPSPTASS